MRRTTITLAAALGTLGLSATALAATGAHHKASGAQVASRLDDGKTLLAKATITEQQAIRAAQSVASGPLDEVDLEYAGRTLVFNVDVGSSDVKVDAGTGRVVATDRDD
jgi:uncharacterized membrane protein YkoI